MSVASPRWRDGASLSRPLWTHAGWIATAGLVLWAAVLHRGLGPTFRSGPGWLRPAGSLLGTVPDELGPALALVALPALAVAIAVYFMTRSALLRTLASTAALCCALFTFYGVAAPGVWSFFYWRWSAVTVAFAALVAVATNAPILLRSGAKLPPWLRVGLYLPVAALLVVLERDITGTDPSLPFAISPWPVLQVFGIEVVASALAALQLGVALGLLGLARGRALGLPGGAAAVAVPSLAAWAGSEGGLLPFHAGPGYYAFTAGVGAVVLLAVWAWTRHLGESTERLGRTMLIGALLLGVPLALGQALTRLDYAETRDHQAGQLIDALAVWYGQHGTYPEHLSELVDAGLIPKVPRPRIGFEADQDFVYQDFGDNYLLEFSGPRWIQCAYNPPWHDEDEDADVEELGGSWSCPAKPPELW